MERKQRWLKFRRRSTPVLMVIAFLMCGYVWITWPETYYQMQCEAPATITLTERFDSAFDCDTRAANLLFNEDNDCEQISCVRIDE